MNIEYLIDKANLEELKTFVHLYFKDAKERDFSLYKDLYRELYLAVNGCHFDEETLEEATTKMVNEDGSTGQHWTLEQTNQVAKQHGISFDHFNQCDWNYVMNMMYSDFYGAVPNEIGTYAKMTLRFLTDKDTKKGKAIYYYWMSKD